MRYSRALAFLVVFNLTISPSTMVRAQELIRINELMAVNDNGLDDEDRDEEDWIEIYNAGMNSVNMEGWYLTDNVSDLRQWAFPEVILAPNTYLVVFASGKNRRDPLALLHTNFKLKGSGEYLDWCVRMARPWFRSSFRGIRNRLLMFITAPLR